MVEIATELIKLASVGIIAGLFSSVVANRDYRQRKWWEMRVTAYQNVIEALSDLVYYYNIHYSAEISYRDLPDEQKSTLDIFWNNSYPKIRKYADCGAFLFSEEANLELQKFLNVEKSQFYIEDLEINLFKSKICLKNLIECSKHDLRLNQSILERFG